MSELKPKAGPVEGLTEEWQSMIVALRRYLRDFAPLNRLIEGEESTDADLLTALLHCIEDINGTPPMTDYTLKGLLSYHQGKLILDGAACNIVESVILHYSRNEIRFTDSGVSIALNDKSVALLRWYQLIKTEYEQKKKAFKIAANVEDITVTNNIGFHSEYLTLMNKLNGYL